MKNYNDLKKKNKPVIRPNLTHICPVCEGYGRWNDSKYEYILIGCAQCDCWGWVTEEDAKCIHEWQNKKIGKCLHEWACIKCNVVRVIDSSD